MACCSARCSSSAGGPQRSVQGGWLVQSGITANDPDLFEPSPLLKDISPIPLGPGSGVAINGNTFLGTDFSNPSSPAAWSVAKRIQDGGAAEAIGSGPPSGASDESSHCRSSAFVVHDSTTRRSPTAATACAFFEVSARAATRPQPS